MKDPAAVVRLVNRAFDAEHLAEEHVFMLACDIKGRTLGLFEVAHGIVNGCRFSSREILIRALLVGAVQIVLVHNHPGGDPEFSKLDIDATKYLARACAVIGIGLVDHIAVGENGWSSAAEINLAWLKGEE